MFHPFKVNGDFVQKILSIYTAGSSMLSGTIVDVDTSDTVAVGANQSVGFSTLRAGSVIPATILSSAAWTRPLGFVIPSVTGSGPSFEERVLQLASSYMTIPVGYAVAIFKPQPGDIIATDQYVGALTTDNGATGALDITDTTKYNSVMGVFQGRLRIKQSGDALCARYLGNTTAPTGTGTTQGQVALFEFN